MATGRAAETGRHHDSKRSESARIKEVNVKSRIEFGNESALEKKLNRVLGTVWLLRKDRIASAHPKRN